MPKIVDSKIQEYIQQSKHTPERVITESDLAPLPEPVQRYMHFTGVVGKSMIKCVKVKQTGFMRNSLQQGWMPVEAVQYSTLAGQLSRTWYAKMKLGPFALLSGYDRYDNGRGHMLIRMLSLFPVADVIGPEIDMSALIIFVNDMVMWPTAFLSDFIHWEPLDGNSAHLIVSLYKRQFTAICSFNEIGEMINFVTEDRYRAVDKGHQRTKWSTPFRQYHLVNGFQIPSEGDAIWHLPEGEFAYIKVRIGEVKYDAFDYA
jgi:Family of unknown function (DUF6544)